MLWINNNQNILTLRSEWVIFVKKLNKMAEVKQEKLKNTLCDLREFDFNFSGHGTEIIFNEEL